MYGASVEVTIGRHQNPWKELRGPWMCYWSQECVLSRLEEDQVQLVRRRSGGGAVFQDKGCSVFTFIFPSQEFNIDRNLDTVLGALRRLDVEAEKKGRNDLTRLDAPLWLYSRKQMRFEGKKISGSAFKHAPDRVLAEGLRDSAPRPSIAASWHDLAARRPGRGLSVT